MKKSVSSKDDINAKSKDESDLLSDLKISAHEANIHYRVGDATRPVLPRGCKVAIIVHICNDVGLWGKGFVLAISKRWKGPAKVFKSKENYEIGTTDFVYVVDTDEEKIIVANMIAQVGVRRNKNTGLPPIRYVELEKCLRQVNDFIDTLDEPASVHMPRIGCGLAGGEWDIVERIIYRSLPDRDVTVYDLPN